MTFSVDRQALRHRLATLTMDEAGIGGSDHPDQLVVDYFDSNSFAFDSGDNGQLDDALRLAVAVKPFGSDGELDYLWAGTANDETYDRILFRVVGGDVLTEQPRGRYAEVGMYRFHRFAGGDVTDAVEYVALLASEALTAANT